VIKTRFEVVGFNEYSGILDAIVKINQQEGFKGFFVGTKVAIMRDVPFSGVYFPIYEEMKYILEGMSHVFGFQPEQGGVRQLVLFSAIASLSANFLSCLLTHPMDIIRTRIIFNHFNKDKTQNYDGLIDAA
jgi:hypothetical protein